MSIVNHVKASIVNESTSHIERLAARITRLSLNSDDPFIRTYPLVQHVRNLSVLSRIREDLHSCKKTSFLGISFVSYGCINYIQFYFSFRNLRLDAGDHITFYFREGAPLEFHFNASQTEGGFVYKNLVPITDNELSFISRHNLDCWKITNPASKLDLYGGFTSDDSNKQYRSERSGQKLFRHMAGTLLKVKQQLN